ncbi:MAG: 3-demethylubiquinone-9 3-methyltransferase family protein [Paucimonas sp.]|nr:3-demethylubiquinone-9 3-methyltransferase family protein [Paucimonas sp.]
MAALSRISPCLWFDAEAEDAAQYYVGIFPHSRITQVSHYTEAGHDIHGQPAGRVMVVAFELDGQPFTALNGGPLFHFSEAISFQVMCEDQQEVDYYWDKLGAGGDPAARQCGWLKDRFGLSWQIVPRVLPQLMANPDQASRTMEAMLGMKKLDVAALEKAAAGG